MEVTQAIAAVTAWIDAVVAQPSGVAPGADRIRVDAQDLGRAGDRQRRVERSRMEQIHLCLSQWSPGENREVLAGDYLPHISCQWSEWVVYLTQG